MDRISAVDRKTKETEIRIEINLDGTGEHKISTGIPFFNHMLTLFSVHGFFDLSIEAKGDLEVDFHHTVEDIGLVLGDALEVSLGDMKGIQRFGHAVVPMDDALASVTIDLSKRPFLVFNVPFAVSSAGTFNADLAKEFFRAFSVKAGMNLHINAHYGENEHHILESIFKATGRALDQATRFDDRIVDVISTKGTL